MGGARLSAESQDHLLVGDSDGRSEHLLDHLPEEGIGDRVVIRSTIIPISSEHEVGDNESLGVALKAEYTWRKARTNLIDG